MNHIPLAFASIVVVAALIAAPGCELKTASDPDRVLRIGYQKWGTYSILKASGRLDSEIERLGLRVEWVEFPSGPPLLEALNAGSIDLGHSGDSPLVFAQAAGVPFLYIAASSPSPDTFAILVRKDSAFQKVSDLKGKKIGMTKGSSGHTMAVRGVESQGLSFSEVEPVYLTPADGRVALESGSIDAWAIWDPYFASAEVAGNVRPLINGRGCVSGREFYFASRRLLADNPDAVRIFFRAMKRAKEWAQTRRPEVAKLLADQTGIDLKAVELGESRRNRYNTGPITGELIAEQQAIADRYTELGLIVQKIDIRTAVADLPSDFQE